VNLNLSAREQAPAREQRAFAGQMELREKAGASGTLLFTGYASVTEEPYEMEDWLGPYSEVVSRGAFGKTLAESPDVMFLINHGGTPLARTKPGTLRLAEDSTGLGVEADLDVRSHLVNDLRVAMERGDLDEMSFAFRVTRQQWSPDYDERRINEVSLKKGDVSVVNFGANPATAGATMRSAYGIDADLLTAALREHRAGAVLSAANAAVIQAAVMNLTSLLSAAGYPAGDGGDPDAEEILEVLTGTSEQLAAVPLTVARQRLTLLGR
jgi:HK97 family phage prohead protease